MKFALYTLSGFAGHFAGYDGGATGTMLWIASVGLLMAALTIPDALRDRGQPQRVS